MWKLSTKVSFRDEESKNDLLRTTDMSKGLLGTRTQPDSDSLPFLYPFWGMSLFVIASQLSVGKCCGSSPWGHVIPGKISKGTLLWVGLDQRHKGGKTSTWFYLKYLLELFNILSLIFFLKKNHTFLDIAKEISTLMSESPGEKQRHFVFR